MEKLVSPPPPNNTANSTPPLRSSPTSYLVTFATLFLVLLVPLAIFGKIADEVHEGSTLVFDSAILNRIHRHSTTTRDQIFILLSLIGGARGLGVLTFLVPIWLWFRQRRSDAIYFFSAVFGAVVLNTLAKQLFRRARPDLWLSPAPEYDFSFPSGHAMLSTAFFSALIVLFWPTKWRWPMLIFGVVSTVSICVSRLYLGVHYPSDIMGGILASLAWVGGLRWLLSFIAGRKRNEKQMLKE